MPSPRLPRIHGSAGTRTASARLPAVDNHPVRYPDPSIRIDLWCGWGGGEGEDGVAVFSPAGTLIGRILLPERAANVCFGGARRNRLFMAASQSLYALYVNTQGATAC